MAYQSDVSDRLKALEDHEARAATLDAERLAVEAACAEAAATVRSARRRAAPGLADRVCEHLRVLAMPTATVEVGVDGEAGEEVEFRLAPNSGSSMLPLVPGGFGRRVGPHHAGRGHGPDSITTGPAVR